MLGWNTIERIVKVIGLKLDGLGDVVVAGNIVPGLFPFIAPGEDLGGEIRAKPASGNSVLSISVLIEVLTIITANKYRSYRFNGKANPSTEF